MKACFSICVGLTCALFRNDLSALHSVHLSPIITRCPNLPTPLELHPSFLELAPYMSRTRYNDDLPTLAHPYRRLMCALEAVYMCVGDVIRGHGDIVFSRLRYPTSHAEGRSG